MKRRDYFTKRAGNAALLNACPAIFSCRYGFSKIAKKGAEKSYCELRQDDATLAQRVK